MNVLERAFKKMGARVKCVDIVPRQRWPREREPLMADFSLDVRTDDRGEYFLVSRVPNSKTDLVALDVQPRLRHLLLLSRKGNEKHRFLLGHDERHWFVAGVPEVTPVSRVRDAMQALKPESVLRGERGIRSKDRDRRRNRARIRQGEWFFVLAPNVVVPELLILSGEPLIRSRGGKPHVSEQLYRLGGETVYVGPGFPNGLTETEYGHLSDTERKQSNWRVMRRNPTVYVRGRVRHADHETVTLDGWHQVLSNTEDQSYAMRNIAFLD
jgi:hypothetical protein